MSKLFAAAHVVGARVAVDLSDTDLTLAEAHLLALLVSPGSMALAELQNRSGNRASSLGSIVDRLERRNLAVRRRSSVDRRAVTVELTGGGRDLGREVEEVFAAAEEALVERGVDVDRLAEQLAAVVTGETG